MKLVAIFAMLAPFVEGFVGGGGSRSSIQSTFVQKTASASPAPSRVHYEFSKPSSSTPISQLFLSDIPAPESSSNEDSLREKDPIQFLKMQINNMDFNAIINAAVIVAVTVSVLNLVVTVDSEIMRGWTAEEMAVRIPLDNWASYSAVLDKSPLPTKAITSATVYTIGDIISQCTEGKSVGEFDRPRVIRSLLAGLIGHGPLSHVWYDVSENLFENILHLQGWFGTIIKVVIDQTTWGPFWNNTYILLLGLMKMDKLENIFGEMKRTTIPLIVSGLKLWPLAHCVTYGLVPVENRLLWVDLVEIIWVTILATAAAGGDESETDAATVEGMNETSMASSASETNEAVKI